MASRLVAKIPTVFVFAVLALGVTGCAVVQELRGDAPWQQETAPAKPSAVESEPAASQTEAPQAQPTPNASK